MGADIALAIGQRLVIHRADLLTRIVKELRSLVPVVVLPNNHVDSCGLSASPPLPLMNPA